jgi:flagellar protein FlgJ
LGLEHISTQLPTRGAIEDSPEAIKEAARTFESLFLNEIMKNMRKTLPQDGLLNQGFANNVFNSMLDQEYSQIASKSGQLGLADVIARQLGADPTEMALKEAEMTQTQQAEAEKTVMIDGEEVPAWALEEIQDDPWTAQEDTQSSSTTPVPLVGSQVLPGLSPSHNSEFIPKLDVSSQASQKAKEAYQRLNLPPYQKR